MKKKLFALPLVVFLLILVIFFYLLIKDRNPSELPSNLLNKNVPKFTADTLINDKKFNSASGFGNKKTLVNFFATWCKPCRDEHVFIESFAEQKDINIIGINYKDNSNKTIQWLKELGNPYKEIIVDKNGSIAIDWGVYGIPETFLVNSKGIIKYRHVGPINKSIYKKINSLIVKIE